MTDADRLRAAAEITEITSYLTHLVPTPGALEREAHERNAVAALLRTVADSARQQGTDAVWWPLVESGIWTDALALADTILGGTND